MEAREFNTKFDKTLPLIPDYVLSLEHDKIDISSEMWKFRARANGGNVLNINWKRIYDIGLTVNSQTVYYLKLYLSYRLKVKKGATVRNDFATFIKFFQWLKDNTDSFNSFNWSGLDEKIARKFLDFCCQNSSEKGNPFSRLREFYSWGISNNYGPFSLEIYRALENIRAIGNLKGHNVRFNHPTKGHFTSDELSLIINALKAGIDTPECRATIMLHLELGINTLSTSMMRNKHFKRIEAADHIFYQVDVPRIKKRSSLFETKRKPISEELGKLLETIIIGKDEDLLCYWLSENSPGDSIRNLMKKFSQNANLVSPRTKQLLNIHPRRFRVTLATNMAEQGSSLEHIIEILDHSDSQNAKVYIETVSTITDSVAEATDKALTPLVKRFQGIIINSINGKLPEKYSGNLINGAVTHLPDAPLDLGGIGGCGKGAISNGLCEFYPPLGCYTCPSFAALSDAPHKKVKTSIENYLKSHKGKLDKKTLSQFDETLAAIEETLIEVSKIKKGDYE